MTTVSPPPGFGFPLLENGLGKARKSKDRKVSWAANDKLCQVRLFVAEDAPVMSGAVQEHLQAKQARFLHTPHGPVPHPLFQDAPPGFGGVAIKPKADPVALALIDAQITWRTPDSYTLDPAWQVTAGENSLERVSQTDRCFRVLEAVYPRPSSIPGSPAEPPEPQESYDDEMTPQIPLVPVDDEDMLDLGDISTLSSRYFPESLSVKRDSVAAHPYDKAPSQASQYTQENCHSRKDTSWNGSGMSATPGRNSIGDQPTDLFSLMPSINSLSESLAKTNQNGAEPDVAAAAAAAYAVLAQSKEVGSMIDNNLLIEILKNPSLMQTLTNKESCAYSNSQSSLSSSSGVVPAGGNQTQIPSTPVSGQWSSGPTGLASISSNAQELLQGRSGDGFNDRLHRNLAVDGQAGLFNQTISANGFPAVMNGKAGITPGNGVAASTGNAPPGFGDVSAPPGFGVNSPPSPATQLSTSQSSSVRPITRYDEQYYKELILQHGRSAQEEDELARFNLDVAGNHGVLRSRGSVDLSALRFNGISMEDDGRGERWKEPERQTGGLEQNRPKSRKTCIYYGTSRGCRNGSSCAFVHELSSEKAKVERPRPDSSQTPYVKRLKVDT